MAVCAPYQVSFSFSGRVRSDDCQISSNRLTTSFPWYITADSNFAFLHKPTFGTLLRPCRGRICRLHFLKVWISLEFVLVALRVPDSCSEISVMIELTIRSLCVVEVAIDLWEGQDPEGVANLPDHYMYTCCCLYFPSLPILSPGELGRVSSFPSKRCMDVFPCTGIGCACCSFERNQEIQVWQ